MNIKVFQPKKLFLPWLCLILILILIIAVLWITLGAHDLTIGFTIGFGTMVLIIPLFAYSFRHVGSIRIDGDSIKYFTAIYEKKGFGYQPKKISIKSIKQVCIIDKKEYRQYDIKSKVSKSLMVILDNEQRNFIALALFTKSQIDEIVKLINEKRDELDKAE